MRERCVLVLVVLLAAACGGGGSPQSPTPASTPPPNALAAGSEISVVSGETGQPIAGARLALGPEALSTDAGGRAVTTRPVTWGSLVDGVAPGFFDRQTILRKGGTTRFLLWPRTTSTGLDEEFTRQMVYTWAAADPGQIGKDPLERIAVGATEAVVALSDELRLDEKAEQAHAEAVAEMNAWIGARVRYVLAPQGPRQGLVFEARVDPADEACKPRVLAVFRGRWNSRREIAGGQIIYCTLAAARTNTVLHELGHSAGLQHVYSSRHEVMAAYAYYMREIAFSEREGLVLNLLFERPFGNRFPDSDRETSAAGGGGGFTIACP